MTSNKDWWTSESNADLLGRFLKRQYKVSQCYLGYENYFSSQTSLTILQIINESEPLLLSLQYLSLQHCKWERKENCVELASLLAKSGALKIVFIQY